MLPRPLFRRGWAKATALRDLYAPFPKEELSRVEEGKIPSQSRSKRVRSAPTSRAIVLNSKSSARAKPAPEHGKPDVEDDVSVRDRMLDIAADLMSQQGYAGTSVSEIVGSAGVGPPTLYWHFKSKRGILAAVMHRGAEQWIKTLPNLAEIAGSTPRERFVTATRIAGDALRRDPQFLRLLIMLSLELSADDDIVRDLVLDIRHEARTWLTAVLQSCWPALPPEDAVQLAAFQMAVADGWIVQREVDRNDELITSEFVTLIVADKAEEMALASRLHASKSTRRRQ